jgi:hypothetical protein
MFDRSASGSLRAALRGVTSRSGWAAAFSTLLFLGVAAAPAGAVDKYAAEFLKIGVGARALGMGGAFVSLSDDASATFWNPAGLVQLESREAMGMHASQFGGVVTHDVLGVVAPLKSAQGRSALGLTIIRLAVDDIAVTKDAKIGEDANGNPILDPNLIEKKSAYDLAFLLSYARSLGDRWSAGANVKLIRQSLVGEGASFGVGADLGLRFQPTANVAFGLRLADVTTTQLFWDTGRKETVAPTVTLGAHATREIPGLQGSLTVGANAQFAFEGQTSDQFETGDISGNILPGAEYWFRRTVALRVGSDAGNFTAGAGIRYKRVGADYAYLSHDELDSTHRVSALVRF